MEHECGVNVFRKVMKKRSMSERKNDGFYIVRETYPVSNGRLGPVALALDHLEVGETVHEH